MIHLSVWIRTNIRSDNSLEISHLSVQIYTDNNIYGYHPRLRFELLC